MSVAEKCPWSLLQCGARFPQGSRRRRGARPGASLQGRDQGSVPNTRGEGGFITTAQGRVLRGPLLREIFGVCSAEMTQQEACRTWGFVSMPEGGGEFQGGAGSPAGARFGVLGGQSEMPFTALIYEQDAQKRLGRKRELASPSQPWLRLCELWMGSSFFSTVKTTSASNNVTQTHCPRRRF